MYFSLFQWLNEEKIVKRLVSCITPSYDEDVSIWVAEQLVFIFILAVFSNKQSILVEYWSVGRKAFRKLLKITTFLIAVLWDMHLKNPLSVPFPILCLRIDRSGHIILGLYVCHKTLTWL